MIPPPRTSSRSGTSPSSSAPVESTDPRVGLRDERQRQRFGAGRDDGLREVDGGGPALGKLDLQLVR
jgi:hypothetical protein